MNLTGQLGLIPHASNPLQWLIQTITRSPVHHVVVAVSETECVGAESPVAIIRPVTHFPNAVWSSFDLTDTQTHKIVSWATAHIGTPYSWLDDLAIGVALITRRATPLWLERYLRSTGHLECAQLADLAYQAAGIHLFRDHRAPEAVYPAHMCPFGKRSAGGPKVCNTLKHRVTPT